MSHASSATPTAESERRFGMLIGDDWVAEAASRQEVRSPATGETLGVVAMGDAGHVDRAVRAARAAQPSLARMSVFDRAALCERIADEIDRDADALARLLSLEQGKPLRTEARPEVARCAMAFRDAGEQVKWMTGTTVPTRDPRKRVWVQRQPRGVYGIITPWNAPLAVAAVYFMAPGLASGNAIVWVPAPSVSAIASAFCACLERADLPPGCVNLITGEGPVVGAALVQHPGVDAIGFTGSSGTGRLVAAAAADKPCFLELGGNGPTIVLGDADLALAAKRIAWGSFTNAGQICTSTERILADASIAGELAARLADEAASVRLGHPLDEATTMGPMHTAAGAARALGQIERATERGAQVLAGGGLQPGSPTEHYFEATVVDRVPAESDLHVDETFAPVAPIVHFARIRELGPLVRASSYGLSGAIFSRDVARAMHLAEHLPCGIVNINETSAYWEPQIPAGGAAGKLSGHGRTAGRWAIEEMTEPRTIVVSLPDDEDEAGIGMTGPASEASTPAT